MIIAPRIWSLKWFCSCEVKAFKKAESFVVETFIGKRSERMKERTTEVANENVIFLFLESNNAEEIFLGLIFAAIIRTFAVRD